MAEATAGYRPDPGGQFASDVHRRVAAHLHSDEEEMGWPLVGLLHRLAEDHATPLPPNVSLSDEGGTEIFVPDYVAGAAQLKAVLDDLVADGLASEAAEGVWVLTEDGYALLTGPIAHEPEEGAEPQGPAVIDLGPVPIGGKATAKAGVKS